ncbi:HNH endonuclease [Gemmata algarum]|uniref:HNH endonuclease n=1 Tax=Gemmata algarum TaxID=2975278 RepID=UPI0038B26ED7
MKPPPFLSECNPESRLYPSDWKWAYYKLQGGITEDGYQCPRCERRFFGPSDFAELHGDHRVSWSQGGRTTWDNLCLLCGPCNLRKSASSV